MNLKLRYLAYHFWYNLEVPVVEKGERQTDSSLDTFTITGGFAKNDPS